MGHVAINAGFYLAAKLEMRGFAEFSPRELFDVEHVDVKYGIIHDAQASQRDLQRRGPSDADFTRRFAPSAAIDAD